MKKALYVFVCVFFIHCLKVESNENKLSGQYIGYFHRNRSDTAQVSLRFTNDHFEGKSDKERYPVVGSGRFEQKDGSIIFHYSGNRPAGTDKTLFLDGSYYLRENDDGSIRIWRESPGCLDEYIFARQAP